MDILTEPEDRVVAVLDRAVGTAAGTVVDWPAQAPAWALAMVAWASRTAACLA